MESKILLHGRMYITDKFICFYSNFFGFEKKVRGTFGVYTRVIDLALPIYIYTHTDIILSQIKIPFSHVLKITKGNTALLIPNSINIVTSRKEYCFRSFWDREETYYQMAVAYRAYRRLPPAPRDAILDSRSLDKDGVMESSAPTSSPFSSTSGVPAPDALTSGPAQTPSPPTPSSAAVAAAAAAAAASAAASAPTAVTPPRATSPPSEERAAASASVGVTTAAATSSGRVRRSRPLRRPSYDAQGLTRSCLLHLNCL